MQVTFYWRFQVTFSDLFRGLSDLHLGDQKVTWKKLVLHEIQAIFDGSKTHESTGYSL